MCACNCGSFVVELRTDVVGFFNYVCVAFSGSRTTRKVNNICCNNFRKGTCRKVICEKCFNDYGWDWARFTKKPSEWTCTHCRDCCPSRAQCAIYRRTNERRREHLQRGVRQGQSKLADTMADRIYVPGLQIDNECESKPGSIGHHRCAGTVRIPQHISVRQVISCPPNDNMFQGGTSDTGM
jgi:hypothetical protein